MANAGRVNEKIILEQLRALPYDKAKEVQDFIEFLAAREERAVAAQRLLESLERLDALNLPPLSEDEVEAEIQAARKARTQHGA